MVSEKELKDWILSKFQLQLGQIVTGVEVWNRLIEAKEFKNILLFLAISNYSLEETVLSESPLMNDLFGMKELGEYERKKFLMPYKISDVKVEGHSDGTDIVGHRVTIYAHRRIEKDTKWSKQEIILGSLKMRK
jgi:hypothetical protein